MDKVVILDSTLRDGAQGEGISFSLQDKLSIAYALDDLGIDYIEAGNPFSNPKDMEFFELLKSKKSLSTLPLWRLEVQGERIKPLKRIKISRHFWKRKQRQLPFSEKPGFFMFRKFFVQTEKQT